jgi:hypothetical protein
MAVIITRQLPILPQSRLDYKSKIVRVSPLGHLVKRGGPSATQSEQLRMKL